jgi:outer membrane protein, heavy metal efflux system
MTLIRLAMLCIASSSFATLAQAQARSEIGLDDVYRIASTSPRVTAASALADAAQTRISSAKRLPDPELQLGFMNRSLPSLAPMDPLGMTQIQLTQMLPVPGKLGLAGRIAADNASAAKARAVDVRWDIRGKAAMAFYDLYTAGAQLGIARETKRIVQDIAKISQTMYSVGDGRQADVLRAQVEVARMTEDITRMESMRASIAAQLAAILNVRTDTALAVSRLPVLPDTLPSLDALIAEANRSRPMITAGEQDLRAAELGEKLAHKEIWPDLEVGVQYGWRSGDMGAERMGSLMLGATIPIYARSRQLKMRDEANAMRVIAAAELEAMRSETRGRITELYADFTRARNLRRLYATTVLPQAEGAITASFAAYRVGDVNFMTLLDNQMVVNRYRQEAISLEAAQGKAIAEIEMLLGRSLFDPSTSSRSDR